MAGLAAHVCAFIGAVVLLKAILTVVIGFYAKFLRPGKDLKKYGKWAVITGATDGIGKAYAFELAKKGLNIILISRTQAKLTAVAQELASTRAVEVETVAVDFDNYDDAAKDRIVKCLAGKDVGMLINNVGMSYDFPQFFTELDDDKVSSLLKLNVDSVTNMTRLVLPGMETRQRGAIVNISSASGLFSAPQLAQYSASKSYVGLLTQGLAAEYKLGAKAKDATGTRVPRKGVHVSCQSPLYVTTKLAKLRHSNFYTPTPEQYVRAAVRQIGYETMCQPWWAHAVIMSLTDVLPASWVDAALFSWHNGIRMKGLKKAAKKAAEGKSN